MKEESQPPEVPDWKHRADYIRARSTRKESTGETNIEPEWADEAFADEDQGGGKREEKNHE